MSAFALACLVAGAVAEPGLAGVSRLRARVDLNAMRAQAGVPPVKRFSSRLNRGCRLHNRYMRATGEFGHGERRGSRHYTRLGALSGRASVLSRPGMLPSEAWGQTVYHRLAVLQPRLRRTGFDSSHGHACLHVTSGVSRARSARAPHLVLHPWPANGSMWNGLQLTANELPSPFADAPGATAMGTPVTFAVNGPWRDWRLPRSRVASAAITSDAGAAIPVSISDSRAPNGAYLQGGFAVLPRQALSPGQWYTVSASGDVVAGGATHPFSITTRFHTAG